MRVLGIDPSLSSTGFGIVDYTKNRYSLISYGTIRPSQRLSILDRIYKINSRIEELISNFKPKEVAIENLFYAKNVKTAITLGQVRGAIMVAVASSNCPLYEYSPLEIKKAVTGYGQADKNQVQQMIKTLLNLQEAKLRTDASDALATAFCHLNSRIFQQNISDSLIE